MGSPLTKEHKQLLRNLQRAAQQGNDFAQMCLVDVLVAHSGRSAERLEELAVGFQSFIAGMERWYEQNKEQIDAYLADHEIRERQERYSQRLGTRWKFMEEHPLPPGGPRP